MRKIRKVRDLTLVALGQGRELVIACDSCGGIGLKPGDALQVDPFLTGRFTARVVLFEVMCAGAEVIGLTNAVCNEMEPTGRQILTGIQAELEAAHIDGLVLTGSTEENFATVSTAVGMTALGLASRRDLRVNTCKAGTWLVAVGEPKVGSEVLASQPGEIPGYEVIRELLALEEVAEIVPVGSKGILYEARELAKNNGLTLVVNDKVKVNTVKSAGPCTVILVAAGKNAMGKLHQLGRCKVIGWLI